MQLEAIPALDVMKAEAEVSKRDQDLTVARTTLQLQESLMKNALTKSLDDPTLEEMPVIPTDRSLTGSDDANTNTPILDLIGQAQKNRPELLETDIDLVNRQISGKAARNALLPTLSLVGFYGGTGLGGLVTPGNAAGVPPDLSGTWQNTFNDSSPDYYLGFNVNIPFRNRVAKADQYRSELEYRQAELRKEQLRKQIRIEVRNAQYSLVQTRARVEAARKARDLAQRTFEITRKEQELGSGSSYQTMTAQRDLALAELDLVTASTTYQKAKVELDRATGTTLEHNGVQIQDAVTGTLSAASPSPMPTSAKPHAPATAVDQQRSIGAGRVLAADDQPHVLEALQLLLRPEGYRVDLAKSPAEVREALSSEFFDAILIDLNYTRDTTSGQEGLDLLSEIVGIDSSLPVIVMTAWGNVELAVEAMRRGARDFVQKPWENERLLAILRTQVELHRVLQQAERLAAENRLLQAQGRSGIHRHRGFHATGARRDGSRRPVRCECPDHRRARQRQGSCGPDFAHAVPTGFPSSGCREHGRTGGGRFRKRIVRPRERSVHGCPRRSHGSIRTCRWRHDLSR